MKHYINILLAVLLTASLSTAKTTSTVEYTFTIHVGAFVNSKLSDFENIRPYGYIYAQKLNNLLQIYMGDYPTEGEASKILTQVKEAGYPDAFITRRSLDDGVSASIIQLGAEKAGANINWANYVKAGPLQTFQTDNTIKIATGPFEDLVEAQNRLKLIKSIGFKDAFIKVVNSVLLHKVTSFETGNTIAIPESYEAIVIPKEPADEVVIAEIPPKKTTMPDVIIKKKMTSKGGTSPKEEPKPKSYEDVIIPKSPPAAKPEAIVILPKVNATSKGKFEASSLSVPDINAKVKRTSVLKLQEILKAKGTYKSSLDGFYGPGTKKGFEEVLANDKELQKYKLLSQHYENNATEKSTLEIVIYQMGNDVATGVSKLKSIKSSLSKTYQAYGIYKLSGKNNETDRLMNEAIKESFSNTKMKNKAPFDYKAKYSYSDYGLLIRHMRYIHSAADENIAVPCWLFENHEKEAVAAFDPGNDISSGDYVIQDCGNIRQWESIKLLETIMKEVTPDLSEVDAKELAKQQSKRATLILSPKAQSIEDYKNIDNWNKELWSGLDKWGTADPLHSKMVNALKIFYFHSWALLEDHYMDKGFSPKEARGLSLCVLKTLVNPYLSRYSD